MIISACRGGADGRPGFVMNEMRPMLLKAALSGNRSQRAKTRHADNFLTSHDLWAHNRYRQLITPLLPAGFVYASQEAEPVVIGDDPYPGPVRAGRPPGYHRASGARPARLHTRTPGACAVRWPRWSAISTTTFGLP